MIFIVSKAIDKNMEQGTNSVNKSTKVRSNLTEHIQIEEFFKVGLPQGVQLLFFHFLLLNIMIENSIFLLLKIFTQTFIFSYTVSSRFQ